MALCLMILAGPIPYSAPTGDLNLDGQTDAIDVQCQIRLFEYLHEVPGGNGVPCLIDADCVEMEDGDGYCAPAFGGQTVCLPGCLAPAVSVSELPGESCPDPEADSADCLGKTPRRSADLNCNHTVGNDDLVMLVGIVVEKLGFPGSADHDGDGKLNFCDLDSDGDGLEDSDDCSSLDETITDCDDNDPCNGVESCNPEGGCLAGEPLVCGDGDMCNGDESCEPGDGCVAGTPLNCDDDNLCTSDLCLPQSGCRNDALANGAGCGDGWKCLAGTCSCAPGFEVVGDECIDYDECLSGLFPCDENATCTNTPGSFECACNQGYTGNGLVCQEAPSFAFTEHTFTNAGATGQTGPDQAAVDAAYSGSEVEGFVTVDPGSPGIQKWTVPGAGPYEIEAFGAEGGYPGIGGRGARMKGIFVLEEGDVVHIAVGQQGSSGTFTSGGGGGGTFVVRAGSEKLIIAGGGGSSGACSSPNGKNAMVGPNGTAGTAGSSGGTGGAGGVDGNGGKTGSKSNSGCGGGGFLTNGENSGSYTGGKAFVNGALGGAGSHNGIGGFGGGGGSGNHGGGGGGGNSGGGGGTPNCPAGVGGGGGSFNAGTSQDNEPGVNTGHGKVIVTLTDANLDSDGDGIPDWQDTCPSSADNSDTDGDGVCDADDLCPGEDDAVDTDSDQVPDGCDSCPFDFIDDSDEDGVCDSADLCPGEDDTLDEDLDGNPDACDPCPLDNPDDSDNDTVCDSDDVCPNGDDTADSDGDGTPDGCDPCPLHYFDDGDDDGECGYDNSQPYAFTAHTFTNAGGSGQAGPTQPQVDLAYEGSEVQGRIDVSGDGIQLWVVPADGPYEIEAFGAEGGYPGIGGKGARLKGVFVLEQGTVVHIAVGQQGSSGTFTSGGGGGGTFVVLGLNQAQTKALFA